MTPNPDLLRTEFLGVTVRFEEVHLDRQDLALLFSQVSERYGLNRFEYHADGGATFAGPEGAEFILLPTQASSCGVTRLGLSEGLQRVGGLVSEVCERYSVGALWIDDATIVAAWDLQEDDAARLLLIHEVMGLDDERLAPLGGEADLSVGLRIWRSLGQGSVDCSLEPMHADNSKVYLRLAYSQPDPEADAAAVCAVIETAGEFLHGPVAEFVLSLARR